MRTSTDPSRDPTRVAALHRLAGATAVSAAPTVPTVPTVPAVPAAPATPTDADPPAPWAVGGERPDRVPPDAASVAEAAAAWADPPWWRRVRWAPDRVAGVALVVLVVALGGFSVHRLIAAVPDAGPPVPELPMGAPGEAAPGEPGPGGAAATTTATPGATAPAGAPTDPLVVSVVGMVHRSGLVSLAPGARVADALDAAGGVREGGDGEGLNLARRVADGEQILVGLAPGPDGPRGPRSGIVGAEPAAGATPGGAPGSAPAAAPGGTPGGAPAGAGLVDLNTADAAGLDALPGVGPVTAASILAWRAANGRFTSVDQLAEVDGIGPATLSRLRPLVTV